MNVKIYLLFFLFFISFRCHTQISESFSDGDFTENPEWTGIRSNFIVNNEGQLQSAALASSVSYLFTLSESVENAVWECRMKINYPTSSSNYACMYIISDVNVLEKGMKGYFVQVGGMSDELSLFLQEGEQKVKIIDGRDKRTEGNPLEISVKVTRDSLSVFRLYSKLPSESEYIFEGQVQNSKFLISKYFGISFANTATTGRAYCFDDIRVTGSKVQDVVPPELTRLQIIRDNRLSLHFSEPVLFSNFQIRINGTSVSIKDMQTAENKESVTVELSMDFQPGVKYLIEIEGVEDVSGNSLPNNKKAVGVIETADPGDIVLNEIMFHQPDSSAEYVEFYNRSRKVLDVSGMVFTTRRADGMPGLGNAIPDGVSMFPGDYLALTNDTAKVRKYHACPDSAFLIQTGWSTLNNESAIVMLMSSDKSTVLDEFGYRESMHHVLVENTKGVALERISPELPAQNLQNWHSASGSHRYGTPGFKNSQYKDNNSSLSGEGNIFRLENQVFSPDNDGENDVCSLVYELSKPGFLANINVLSAGGERVYTLVEQYLLGQNGYFLWNGCNNEGKISNIGIYVIFIELFHPESGERKRIKLPVVLSSQ